MTATVLSPLATIAVLVAAAASVPLVFRRWPRAAGPVAALASAGCFVAFLAHAGAIAHGQAITQSIAWVPSLGVTAAFNVDGLALLFALLITGIGAIIVAYTPVYTDHAPATGRLLGLLLAFEAAMVGLVTADDTITLFVFWELTSFTSFFLISFDASTALARTRARQALVITAGGGLALLVGLLLLANTQSGGTGVAVILSTLREPLSADHPHYAAIVLLVAAGAFTKSAQLPFHFWLPGAMVAPSPVSAYLHSATMVKAGIYLLARLHPTLGGTTLWVTLLVGVGGATFVVGAVLATLQRDAKLTLAYATVAVLGALTLLLGIGTTYAIGGAMLLVIAHACYKAALFLTVGNLDHHRGTRDPLAPLPTVRDMPFTAACSVIAAASMAGIPPLLGFIAKDALLAATLQGAAATVVTAAAVIAGAGLVTAAWLAGVAPFLRGRARWTRDDVAWPMLVGPSMLAAAALAFGLLPELVAAPLISPAASAIAGRPVEYEVALWPGIAGVHGLAFLLGLASIALGAAGAVLAWRHRERILAMRDRLAIVAGARAHEAALDGVMATATRLSATIQHGRLPMYVACVVATIVGLVALPLLAGDVAITSNAELDVGTYELPLLAIAAISVVAAAALRHRLDAVAALATTGLAVTFLFALFSGPDLAITQLTVETMMVILLVFVFRKLPPSKTRERMGRRGLRVAVAGAGGLLITLLLLATTAPNQFERTAAIEQTRASPGEGFSNVVNAILVDFRALDTLGEITVLAIAGIGVAALVGHRRRR